MRFRIRFRLSLVGWLAVMLPGLGAAPNVIVILWDDIGFAQFGCYGSPIATPNIDRLAAEGVRYTNFNVAPVCSPTRAALLTGRNPHRVGMACITEFANGERNSRGGLRRDAGTVAEYLRTGGYSTFAVGKWHLTPMTDLNVGASSEHWPTGRGFDHFYGFMSGETNPWAPEFFRDRAQLKLPPVNGDGSPKHAEVALTDQAIEFIGEQRATAPQKPFFLYLAYCAGHAPHHVPAEYLEKWRGKFDQGWDAVRAETLARQKRLGVVPADAELPPRNPGVKAWSELPADERRLYARYYETFAAFVEHTDAQMGRLLDYLKKSGELDNTLIVLTSDNGASPEGGPEGMWNEVRLFTTSSFDRAADGLKRIDGLGLPQTYPTYPTGWTMAGCTPFRRTKGTTHEGGVRVPLIMRWPAGIKDAGGVRSQFHSVVDLMPTILETAGVKAPAMLDGREQPTLDGTSMSYTWGDAGAASRRTTQYVEIYGHRSIIHEGWKAVAFHVPGTAYANDVWELYNLAVDFNERNDLAKARPEKLAEMLAVWEREAAANDVYPLDDRRGAREMLLPADSAQRGPRFEFFPPMAGVHKGAAPDLRGRSWRLTADIEPQSATAPGVIVAFGGRFAGFALYVREGRLVFHYNYAGDERTMIASNENVPIGTRQFGLSFTLNPAGGADVVLTVDGREAGRGHVPRVMGQLTHETFDLGCDLFTPVSEDYVSPARYRGTLGKVVIEAVPFAKPN